MTEDETLAAWLADEVRDLFQAGGVGLYEFIELLDSDDRPPAAAQLSEEERREVAHRALATLVAGDDCTLRWKVWATDYNEPASPADVRDAAWQIPGDGPYLAIELVSDRPSRPDLSV